MGKGRNGRRNVRAQLKGVFATFRLNLKNVLAFELLYRLVTLPGYIRLTAAGMKWAMECSGYSYITLGNLGAFLLKPWTIGWMAFSVLLAIVLLWIESSCLTAVYQAAAYYRILRPLDIAYGGYPIAASLFQRKSWQPLGLTAAEYGLLNIYLIFWILSRVKPVNFVMDELMAQPAGRLGIVLLVVFLVLYTVPRLFAVHYFIVEQRSWRDSIEDSKELFRKHWKRVLPILGLVNVGIVAIMFLLRNVVVVAAALLTEIMVSEELVLAVLTQLCDRISLVVLFLTSLLLAIGNSALTAFLYHRLERHAGGLEWWQGMKVYSIRISRRRILTTAGVACGISCFVIFDMVYNGSVIGPDMLSEVQITAHRGSSQSAPENTMAALEAAVEELADYAEIDVQYSSDQIIVVCHDTNLSRVAGVGKKVGELTFEELRGLDVGSWFSEEFAGEQIPSLEEVLDYCKGKIYLNIELKNIGRDTDLPERVAAMIREKDMADQCVVTSVSLSYLDQIKEVEPDIRTGFIVAAAYGDYYTNPAVDFISLRSSLVTRGLVERAHEAGRAVHAWTVNTPREIRQMEQAGVDNIITDYPVLVRNLLYQEEGPRTLMEMVRTVLN